MELILGIIVTIAPVIGGLIWLAKAYGAAFKGYKCDKCGKTCCSQCSNSTFCNVCISSGKAGPPGSGIGIRRLL